MPKICLNMIVKNESKIIERLLQSVLPFIDNYCICDTGSDDNTIDVITEFFKDKDISGKIVRETFQRFWLQSKLCEIGMSGYGCGLPTLNGC